MTDDLISCYKDCEKLMPIIHLPVQSGSNKILKSMNRKHDKNYYLNIVKKLKNINNNIKFSSDFIIGYPGETNDDYNETINLIKKVGFINSYSFIYSPRPGTPASDKKLNNLNINKAKLKKLQSILEDFQFKDNENSINKYFDVLVENKLKNENKYFGRTKFMTAVKFESKNCKPGDLVNIKITSCNSNSLFGFQSINKNKAA